MESSHFTSSRTSTPTPDYPHTGVAPLPTKTTKSHQRHEFIRRAHEPDSLSQGGIGQHSVEL